MRKLNNGRQVTFSVSMSPLDVDELERVADHYGLPRSALVRQAIRGWLSTIPKRDAA